MEAEELAAFSMVDLLKVGGLDTMSVGTKEVLVKAEMEDMAQELVLEDTAFRELKGTAKEAEGTVGRELGDMPVRQLGDTTSLVVA